MDKVRLSKLMAQRGLCSRREADRYIVAGLALVDGAPITQLGTRVPVDSNVTLAPHSRQAHTILLNKPVGFVSAQAEQGKTPAIQLLTPQRQHCGPSLNPRQLSKLAVAGRLDSDSQGLLVFTQDGRIARQLIGPHSSMEKEYIVRVRGSEPDLDLLRFGLCLDGRPLKPAIVERINRDQLRFILTEGRKRQIRRMCALVGLTVTGLKRVRIGAITLASLPSGQWRPLNPQECF